MTGYVYAYRKAWFHSDLKNLREAAIWNFLYQNAYFQDGIKTVSGCQYKLKRGQLIVSVSFLASGFEVSEKVIRLTLNKLEKLNMITTERANKGTIITICNYAQYQTPEKQKGEQGAIKKAIKNPKKGDQENSQSIDLFEQNETEYEDGAIKIEKKGEQKGNNKKEGSYKEVVVETDNSGIYFQGKKIQLTENQFMYLLENYCDHGKPEKLWKLIDKWDEESQVTLTYSKIESRLSNAQRKRHG